MKLRTVFPTLSLALAMASWSHAAESTGEPFHGDAPDEHHPWAVHDRNRPQPPVVTPGSFSTQETPGTPPSDAIILFGGTEADVSKWEADKNPAEPTKWVVKDGDFECVPGSGYVRTKEEFGDCQLHVEWASPTEVHGDSQGRGNSGVFLMGLVEIQVLDNYKNPTYADGFASSVYGQYAPYANALREPGQWEVYDIVFRRPIWKDGKEVSHGSVTVFCNGVLTMDHAHIEGPTGHAKRTDPTKPFPDKGPLKLQDHGNPVRYRNIWIRPLPPRTIEGGDNGPLSAEVTKAKRHEIAAGIRDAAAKLEGDDKLLHLLESLVYEADADTLGTAEKMAAADAESFAKIPADQIESHKGQILALHNALQYLIKFNDLPADFAPSVALKAIVKEHQLDKKEKKK
jgi:3-keto-disaccharide hydrolase